MVGEAMTKHDAEGDLPGGDGERAGLPLIRCCATQTWARGLRFLMMAKRLFTDRSTIGTFASAAMLLAWLACPAVAQQEVRSIVGFTVNQAIAGKSAYDDSCAACHVADLTGAGPAVALRGSAFMQKWAGQSAGSLFAAIRRMPPGQSENLTAAQSASILAYLLQSNGVYPGQLSLPASSEVLSTMVVPASGSSPGAAPAKEPRVIAARGGTRLDNLSELTDEALRQPPAGDWLHWRRTYDSLGFSPLKAIRRENVGRLKLAWAWSLPPGDNMMAPIVHDGVLFAYSHGDVVEALDAASGELLWRYERMLAPGAAFQGKKGVAIAGDMILVPTSDMHVLALEAKTGVVRWDHTIDTGGQTDFQIKSSPLAAADKIIVGVNGFTTRGGNFIVALDQKTGAEVWRFKTVAQPGEPGGNSWNGETGQARTGGSVWVAGSYDPSLNLVYFGAAPTYNPGPLRVAQPNFTTEALYTDATVALNADTGKLVWYFQHQKNDQLDHDWAYEHQLMDLAVDGAKQKVVVTGGKQAIFEAMDAATGKYLFSLDLGMQNVFLKIDPKTGDKTINPAAVPLPKQIVPRTTMPGICPDLLGARNLMSTAYDAKDNTLFVPLSDTCIQPWPTGQRWQKHPDPSSAGLYGMLQAIDLKTRKVRWTIRERAAPVSGALATAGGIVFLGDADRWFRAYDTRNGLNLWETRLDNAPASYPVTYRVDGKQYVAVATNQGFVHVQAMREAAGITPPPNAGATLWVFALPK